jgi:hypothetical protein
MIADHRLSSLLSPASLAHAPLTHSTARSLISIKPTSYPPYSHYLINHPRHDSSFDLDLTLHLATTYHPPRRTYSTSCLAPIVINTGPTPLCLFTVYAPAEHNPKSVHKTKEEGDKLEDDGKDEPPEWSQKGPKPRD